MNPSKKLKSTAPDLHVEVGPEKKVYEYHSVIFASFSPYIDSMLAAPMQESETRRITFPEIPLEVWDKMIKYLEEGVEDMTFEDAEQVIPMYDKYRFDSGVKRVNTFLAKEVANEDLVMRMKETADVYINYKEYYSGGRPHPMDWFIKRLKLSKQYNLEEAREACIESLEQVLQDKKARLMIFVRYWIPLASFIVGEERLWDPIAEVLWDVGEANKDKFVKASQNHESTVFFKMIRLLFEKAYAIEKGVAFP